jgi:hypothetical protein
MPDELEKYRKALADYVSVLARSSIETKKVEDRSLYQLHLAQAALMFMALEKDSSVEKLRQITAMVRQVYQLNPLQGEAGKAAESAFKTFSRSVEDC